MAEVIAKDAVTEMIFEHYPDGWWLGAIQIVTLASIVIYYFYSHSNVVGSNSGELGRVHDGLSDTAIFLRCFWLYFIGSGISNIYQGLHGTVRVFRQKFTLEDAIGSHACSLEANTRVINGIPLGSSLLLPVCTVNCAQTLKVLCFFVKWLLDDVLQMAALEE